jgi:serine/threonine-protein kinase
MLYELLCGSKPFEGESIAELLFKISSEKHPSPKEKNPAIPDSLVAVIDKLLEKNPDTRYQRGSEVSRDLAECLKALA